jgi:DNA replication ATP-dependent helicase Dna2
MILVSSQTSNLVGMSQGFVRSIGSHKRRFTLLVDKNLRTSHADHLFRIDKINFRAALSLNYTNLGKLMGAGERARALRSFLIDKRVAQFDSALPKQYILQNKAIFRQLNQSQQAAIIKTLMAKDYLLIKGYPGTGKTTTIASLIAILVNLGKRVLFTSFTNSAVDNLLLKVNRDVSFAVI